MDTGQHCLLQICPHQTGKSLGPRRGAALASVNANSEHPEVVFHDRLIFPFSLDPHKSDDMTMAVSAACALVSVLFPLLRVPTAPRVTLDFNARQTDKRN